MFMKIASRSDFRRSYKSHLQVANLNLQVAMSIYKLGSDQAVNIPMDFPHKNQLRKLDNQQNPENFW